MNNEETKNSLQPTGLDELDIILHGGIPLGSSVLLSGSPGTGKTILCTQWLFEGFRKYQEPGIYISLTEPVSKAMRNAQKMSFYDEKIVNPLQVYFTDLRGIMEGLNIEFKEMTFDDIGQITDTIKLMVAQSKAKRVVIDSITAMAYYLKEKSKVREFIFRLSSLLNQIDANVIMTSESSGPTYSAFDTEEYIADGIIKMSTARKHGLLTRRLEVVKMRGTNYENYPTTLRITKDGINFFPHIQRELTYPVFSTKLASGIEGLDAMTSGGIFKGSASLISGPSGTGKTLFGLQFMYAGLLAGEKVLFVGFEESQDQLFRLASTFNWDFKKFVDSGQLTLLCSYPEEHYPDEHLDRIRQITDTQKIDRVIVDSLSAVSTVFSTEILTGITSRLIAFFKQAGITSYFTIASTSFLGTESISDAHISTLFDNLFMLRFIEVESELKHMLLVLKMRGSAHDKKLREIIFSKGGLHVTTPFVGYENALSGEAKKVSQSIEDQLKKLLITTLGPAGEKIFIEEQRKGLTIEKIEQILTDLADQRIISRRKKQELTESFRKIVTV